MRSYQQPECQGIMRAVQKAGDLVRGREASKAPYMSGGGTIHTTSLHTRTEGNKRQ